MINYQFSILSLSQIETTRAPYMGCTSNVFNTHEERLRKTVIEKQGINNEYIQVRLIGQDIPTDKAVERHCYKKVTGAANEVRESNLVLERNA